LGVLRKSPSQTSVLRLRSFAGRTPLICSATSLGHDRAANCFEGMAQTWGTIEIALEPDESAEVDERQ